MKEGRKRGREERKKGKGNDKGKVHSHGAAPRADKVTGRPGQQRWGGLFTGNPGVLPFTGSPMLFRNSFLRGAQASHSTKRWFPLRTDGIFWKAACPERSW